VDLVKRLEIYRLERRIPQQELARMLGVGYPTVNRWFNGKCKPNKIHSFHIKKLLSESRKK